MTREEAAAAEDALRSAANGDPLSDDQRAAIKLIAPYAKDLRALAEGKRAVVLLLKGVMAFGALLGTLGAAYAAIRTIGMIK